MLDDEGLCALMMLMFRIGAVLEHSMLSAVGMMVSVAMPMLMLLRVPVVCCWCLF